MGKGGGDAGDSEVTVRYAPYLEDAHIDFIHTVEAWRNTDIGASPFTGYAAPDLENAFFGSALLLSGITPLFTIYTQYMGIDVNALFDQIFLDTTTGPLISNLVSEQALELQDDLDRNALPRFETGMRDINAVTSSTFVIGRAVMQGDKTKATAKFDAELRYKMVPVAVERWKTLLNWNKDNVVVYSELIKLYLAEKISQESHGYEIVAKHTLWPFTVLEYNRLALSALTNASNTKTDVQGASTAEKVVGGGMMGAGAGFMVGGAPGAVIGGVLGLASGFF